MPLPAADHRMAALGLFDVLPWHERWFVRGRLRSAPLEQVVSEVPECGIIVDVGCGHGLLTALLAVNAPARQVLGIDPDPRKIAWAQRGPGRLPNASFVLTTVEQLARTSAGQFDAVVAADVLYLVPRAQLDGFLACCRALLRAGGRFVLKEVQADGSWKYRKALLQETFMVRIARRTLGSGEFSFQPLAALQARLRLHAFRLLKTLELSRHYSTPHVLLVAERSP